MRALRVLALLLALSVGVAHACGANTQPNLIAWSRYYAQGFGLDPDFFEALVWTESNFCINAVSKTGAIGLTQLMPGTAKALGVNPHDPFQNLWAGAKYLREQYMAFGDWTLALAAYNAGPSKVRKYGGVPPYKETHDYITKVFATYRKLKYGY